MKSLDHMIMKYLLKLHSYLYYRISLLALKLNNGIHPKHRIMDYHKFFLENIEVNSKILDIGCGYGAVAHDMAKKAKIVVACDINKENLKIASTKFQRENITFIYADATKYDFKDKFDFIILSNVLEHIKNRTEFLKKIKNQGNCLLIRVPMINRSWLTLYKKELGLDYRLDDSHYIEYTIESFEEELASAKLRMISFSIQFGELWAKVINV